MPDQDSRLPEWIKPGVSFDVVYGNRNDKLWHVRGIVDGLAVCRRWRKEKADWHYEVLDPAFFEVAGERIKPRSGGNLTENAAKAT